MNLPYRIFRALFISLFKLLFRLEVIAGDNVPEKGGVIVVANHVSFLDPLVIGCAIKKRQATYMARQGLFKIPIIRIFVKTFSFPVDRKKTQPSTIKEAVRRLKNSELLVMFPEGGRSKSGTILDAKRGVGMIAAMADAVVVPAFIDGTDKALPVGSKLIKPAKVRVLFGKPIKIEGKEKGKDFQEKIANDIMEAVRSLKNK